MVLITVLFLIQSLCFIKSDRSSSRKKHGRVSNHGMREWLERAVHNPWWVMGGMVVLVLSSLLDFQL